MKCGCFLAKCAACVATLSVLGIPLATSAEGATVTTASVTDFGAVGDGVTDDTLAIRTALDSLDPGDTLVFPQGKTFVHTDTITVGKNDVRLTGGGVILATNEQRSMFLLNNNNIRVDNLTFRMGPTSKRWVEYEKMKLRLRGFSGITLTDVTVDGSAAAGIYVGGASNFYFTRVTVQNTRADAIHMTEGASYGTLTDVVVRNPGDDGIAVVSYKNGKDAPVRNITVNNPHMYGQTWGRAFAVVGGNNIVWNDIYAERSACATVYIAAEKEWVTYPVNNVTVNGGVINYANQNATVDHGAILIYNSQAGTTNNNIVIKNVRINATRPTASRQIGILNNGGLNNKVTLYGITIVGGPRPFYSNAPRSAYSVSASTYNGRRL